MISEQRTEALKKIHYLWRLDDAEWVKERKSEWKYLVENQFSDSSAKDIKQYSRYFLKGEQEEHIGEVLQLIFTPYLSAINAKEIFYSKLFTPYDRSRIFSGYIGSAYKYAGGMPWLRQHVQFFVEGILGEHYQVIYEQDGPNSRVISPDPTFFCLTYCASALKVIDGKIPYHGVIECIGYFTSALEYAVDASLRMDISIDRLIQSAEAAIDDQSLLPLNVDYAKEIIKRKSEILENWNKNSHLDKGDS